MNSCGKGNSPRTGEHQPNSHQLVSVYRFLLGSLLIAGQPEARAQTGPTLGEALDATNLIWTTGSTVPASPWIAQTNVTHDGAAAVQGGGLTQGTFVRWGVSAQTWIQTTVTGPTNVTFWWKLALHTNEGRADFNVGSTTATTTFGSGYNGDWEPHTIQIPQGVQTLQWSLRKGSLFVNTDDQFWLDQVSLSGPLAPSILIQPTSQLVSAGTPVTFALQVLGTEPLAYQWLCNGTNVPGAATRSLVLKNPQPGNPSDFTVVVTNAFGSVTSQVATLAVTDSAPSFSSQPLSQGACWGSTVSFSGAARGSEPLAWQWYGNGDALAGATTSKVSVTNVQAANFGRYWAVVTNSLGGATSSVVSLTCAMRCLPVRPSTPPSSDKSCIGCCANPLAVWAVLWPSPWPRCMKHWTPCWPMPSASGLTRRSPMWFTWALAAPTWGLNWRWGHCTSPQ